MPQFLEFLPKGLDVGKQVTGKLGMFGKFASLMFWGKVGVIVLFAALAIIIGLLVYVLIKKKNK